MIRIVVNKGKDEKMSHVKDILEAHKIGFAEGFEKGSHEGFFGGFNKGFNKGFDEGTCVAWEKANVTIASLTEMLQKEQAVADGTITSLSSCILGLEETISALEREIEVLKFGPPQ